MTKILTCFFIVLNTLLAQANEESYKSALFNYENKNYNVALIEFQKLKNNQISSFKAEQIDYYILKSSYYTSLDNLTSQFKSYLIKYPNSKNGSEIHHLYALYLYNNEKYEEAIEHFLAAATYSFDKDTRLEYDFKLAYSYLMNEQDEKAITLFFKIKEIESAYQNQSIYYYSHLEYLKENYKTALKGFELVKYDPRFVDVANYYIVNINYQLGKYLETIKLAKHLVSEESKLDKKNLLKLIGDSYLALKDYTNAIEYFLKYKSRVKETTRELAYNIALCYYKIEEFNSAITYFKRATKGDDSLAQNAYFYIASSYVKQKEFHHARTAFKLAMNMDFDKYIEQESMFNYAKLSYQLRPLKDMDNEVKALMDFIEKYPNSNHNDEAYSFLIDAFTNTRKYSETLKYIEKIKDKTPNILAIKQNIAFNRAVELYNEQKYQQAIPVFKKAQSLAKYNKEIAAKAYFWEAEIYYKNKEYDKALKKFQEFQLMPGSFGSEEFNIAYYNIAYINFKKKQYSQSIPWLKKFISNYKNINSPQLSDAYIRLADCYFLGKKYDLANTYYQGVQKLNTSKKDYALFQSAITYGLVRLYNDKIAILNKLTKEFPKSAYSDDAYFEMGKTYFITQRPNKAIKSYKKLIKDYKYSKLAPNANLQIGLIYFNKSNYPKALQAYKLLIKIFPKTQYAKRALKSIQNIYTTINKPDEFIAYVEQNKEIGTITASEKEKLYFSSAERLYEEENYLEAAMAFKKYNDQFPNGLHTLKAKFFEAESNFEIKKHSEALKSYEYVANIPNNEFLNVAIKKSAIICYKDSIYDKAVKYFSLIEQNSENPKEVTKATIGLMRSYSALDSISELITYAEKVKLIDKIELALIKEANLVLAKAYEKTNNIAKMQSTYKQLAKHIDTPEGAEAKYKLIKFFFDKKMYELAKEECFDFAKKNTSQRFWLAKSFIILADIYLIEENSFQAKATLNSIINNYKSENDSIVASSKSKLSEILKQEKKAEEKQKENTIQKLKITDSDVQELTESKTPTQAISEQQAPKSE